MNTLGIIPAKQKSSRLKNKNILKINKKRLIEYSFISAIKSKVLNNIIVTTDSKLISDLAKKNKIDVRKRPKKLSKVNSNINCVILDVLRYFYNIKNFYPDLIVLMEPTSPLRSSQTIVDVVNFFKNNKFVKSILPVTKKNNLIAVKKKKIIFFNNKNILDSRKRESYLEINSLIWGVRVNYFLKKNKVFDENSTPFFTNYNEVLDINNVNDFRKLKKIIKK
jgi:CMP-N,N'-diacetyllegionaminic acid synthase